MSNEGCIVDNSYIAMNHAGGPRFDVTYNWWGAPDGPSGAGAGSGDSVSGESFFTLPYRSDFGLPQQYVH